MIIWCKSADQAIEAIVTFRYTITLLDLDYDLGAYSQDGEELLKWLEENNLNIPIHLHTQNLVNRMNMQAIIQKNNWKEIT